MKKEDFMTAIELLSMFHTTKLTINQPMKDFVGDLGEKRWTIHITRCVPAATSALLQAGYSLGMDEYGLYVNKF